jgi:hypothetical protein
VTVEPEDEALSVQLGRIELPIAGYYPAILGFGAGGVTLFLEPTVNHRLARFELSIHQAFRLGASEVDDPTRIGDHATTLFQHEIERAVTTPGDGLDIEFARGDRLVVDGRDWELRGSDGSQVGPQPNGGIATWSGRQTRRIADYDATERDAMADPEERSGASNEEVESAIDIGAGIDLPGAGLHVDSIEINRSGGVGFALTGMGDPADEWQAMQEMMDAARFMADLRIDPAATPPDPEVLDSMTAAVAAADLALSSSVFIRLWIADPAADDMASRATRLLGSVIESVRCLPGAVLEVVGAEGVHTTALQWSVWRHGGPTWSGEDGRAATRPEWRAVPLDLSEVEALAGAWLDHDRTGHKSRSWAWERVSELVQHQPITGWVVVRRLIAGAEGEQQLMSVAAGPLEDLLGGYSRPLLNLVEDAARSDPRVMRALAGVWKSSIDDQDWEQIQAVLGR